VDGIYQANTSSSNASANVGGQAATLSYSSRWSSSYDAYNAFDGSTGNKWYCVDNNFSSSSPYNGDDWLAVDFGVGNIVTITGLRRYTDPSYCADVGYLEWSDNGSTFTKVTGSDFTAANCNTEGWKNEPDF
jgi:hypothetical protein